MDDIPVCLTASSRRTASYSNSISDTDADGAAAEGGEDGAEIGSSGQDGGRKRRSTKQLEDTTFNRWPQSGTRDARDHSKPRKACITCGNLKMKCILDNGQLPCARCKKANRPCQVAQRKKRVSTKPPAKEFSPSKKDDRSTETQSVMQTRPRATTFSGLPSASTSYSEPTLAISATGNILSQNAFSNSFPHTVSNLQLNELFLPPKQNQPVLHGQSHQPIITEQGSFISSESMPAQETLPESLTSPHSLLLSASAQAARAGVPTAGPSGSPNAVPSTLQPLAQGGTELNASSIMSGSLSTTHKEFDPLLSISQSGPAPSIGVPASIGFNLPEMLKYITFEQADELFRIFFDEMQVHAPFIDKQHSSPAEMISKSHLLFHAICGIAVRFWDGPEGLQDRLVEIVSKDLDSFPRERSLECVQAQLLFTIWDPGCRQSMTSDDVSLRTALAIRLAIELDLPGAGKRTYTKAPRWYVKSAQRTWAMCFVGDRTCSVHLGRPTSAPSFSSEYWTDLDVDDMRLISSAEWSTLIESIVKAGKGRLYATSEQVEAKTASQLEDEVEQWRSKWLMFFSSNNLDLRQLLFRRARLRMYHQYAVLIISSYSMQHIAKLNEPSRLALAVAKCQTAAVQLLDGVCEDFALLDVIKYLPDIHLANFSFAAISLLECASIADGDQYIDSEILERLIRRVISRFRNAASRLNRKPEAHANFLEQVLRVKLIKIAPGDHGRSDSENEDQVQQLYRQMVSSAAWQTLESYGVTNPVSSTEFADLLFSGLPSRAPSPLAEGSGVFDVDNQGTVLSGHQMETFQPIDDFNDRNAFINTGLWDTIFMPTHLTHSETPFEGAMAPQAWTG